MYPTSKEWKDTYYEKATQKVMNIYIDDELVNPDYILDLKKGGLVFEEEFKLGSTPSQYIEIKVYKNHFPTKPSNIRIEYGILVKSPMTMSDLNNMLMRTLAGLKVKSLVEKDAGFEIIPIGEYNVDDYVDNDDSTITIKALDNMIKFDSDDGYYDASELINKKGYATLGELAQDICNKKGVVLRFYFFFEC